VTDGENQPASTQKAHQQLSCHVSHGQKPNTEPQPKATKKKGHSGCAHLLDVLNQELHCLDEECQNAIEVNVKINSNIDDLPLHQLLKPAPPGPTQVAAKRLMHFHQAQAEVDHKTYQLSSPPPSHCECQSDTPPKHPKHISKPNPRYQQ